MINEKKEPADKDERKEDSEHLEIERETRQEDNLDRQDQNPSQILQFCPECGAKIMWRKDLKFCQKCGVYLIPFIPRDQISDWMGKDLNEDEINQLYSIGDYPENSWSLVNEFGKIPITAKRKLWNWKAALVVPILAYIAKFLLILGVVFLIIGVNILSSSNPSEEQLYRIIPSLTLIDLSTQVIFILFPYYALKYYVPKNTPKEYKWKLLGLPFKELRRKDYIREILLGIVFAFVMWGIVLTAEYFSAYFTAWVYHLSPEQFLENSSSDLLLGMPGSLGMLIIFVILMYVSIGPSEEILFRGFTQQGFVRSWGKAPALIITAIYFSLFHIYLVIIYPATFLFLFIPYFVLSLILGAIALYRKNLIAVIIAHATYDSIQFIFYFVLVHS
ncbi:MAG: CPBP family glutamic-type intramembrane protease [Promethearchaeota archaeon]